MQKLIWAHATLIVMLLGAASVLATEDNTREAAACVSQPSGSIPSVPDDALKTRAEAYRFQIGTASKKDEQIKARTGGSTSLNPGIPLRGVIEEYLAFVDHVAREESSADGNATTMGAVDAKEGERLTMALDAYLHVLRTWPGYDSRGKATDRALALCLKLGDLDRRAEALRRAGENNPTGLLYVLCYRIERTRRNGDEALKLMELMMADAARFLPNCAASRAALLDAFEWFLTTSDLESARKAAEVLGACQRPSAMTKVWTSLAKGYANTERRDEARRILDDIINTHPGTAHSSAAARAKRTLLGPVGGASRGTMAAEELAQLAASARAKPGSYVRLAREYAKAGWYAEAQETYEACARRFNSASARMAMVLLAFEQGDEVNGKALAEAYVQQHPDDAKAKERFTQALHNLYTRNILGYFDEGLIQRGLEAARAHLERYPDGPATPGHDRLGHELWMAGLYAEARKAFEILANEFGCPVARRIALAMYFEDGKVQEGLEALAAHKREYPGDTAVDGYIREYRDWIRRRELANEPARGYHEEIRFQMLKRIASCFDEGKVEQGLKAADTFVRRYPDATETEQLARKVVYLRHMTQAEDLVREGFVDRAKEVLRSAIEVAPNDAARKAAEDVLCQQR